MCKNINIAVSTITSKTAFSIFISSLKHWSGCHPVVLRFCNPTHQYYNKYLTGAQIRRSPTGLSIKTRSFLVCFKYFRTDRQKRFNLPVLTNTGCEGEWGIKILTLGMLNTWNNHYTPASINDSTLVFPSNAQYVAKIQSIWQKMSSHWETGRKVQTWRC